LGIHHNIQGKNRTRRDTEFTMRTRWFIDNCKEAFQQQSIHRAKSDACSTPEAPIIIYDEYMSFLSRHGSATNRGHVRLPHPHISSAG